MLYLFSFLLPFFLSLFFTPMVIKLARRWKILDIPQRDRERKIHQEPIPLLGGLAIFLSFFLILSFLIFFSNQILGHSIPLKSLIGIFLGGLLIVIGGFLDDKYNLKPSQQIIWPILAVIIVIASGVGVKYISNPLGGIIHFDAYKFEILKYQGIPYYFTLLADIFTFFWLMILMYTTKFLDGLDGLVSGISVIGGLIIAGLCLATKFFQPEVATIAFIFVGACLGFLIFNFHPAKIFLGEGGSLFCGFILGVLAIISGGKIATTLFILGIPVLDLIWVILRRLIGEHRAPWTADKKHLHFRLLDIGFSQRQAVLFLYFIAFVFGIISLFLKSFEKLIALVILIILMFVLILIIIKRQKSKVIIEDK